MAPLCIALLVSIASSDEKDPPPGWYVLLERPSSNREETLSKAKTHQGSVVLDGATFANLDEYRQYVVKGPYPSASDAKQKALAIGDKAAPMHTGDRSRAEMPSQCGSTLNVLHREMIERAAETLTLTSAKDSPPCNRFDEVATVLQSSSPPSKDFHVGKLGGHPAVVHSWGPSGSGRFWTVTLAVQSGDDILGACIETTTVAWRNIHRSSKEVGPWLPLNTQGNFILWTSLPGDPNGPAPTTQLLLPLEYELQETELVLNEEGTNKQLLRMADIYEQSARKYKERLWLTSLHQNAARAFRAYLSGKTCQ